MGLRVLSDIPKPSMDYRSPLPRHGDANVKYKTMHVQNLAEDSKSSHLTSEFFKTFGRKKEVTDGRKLYDGVNPNKKNVWLSLNKMFDKPSLTYDKKLLEGRVFDIVKRVLGPHLRVQTNPFPELVETSVPGAWWKYFGFRTKEEVMKCPQFYDSWMECRNGVRDYPPYATAGKRELLKKVEILENKIRTFLMASPELLMDEKFLYGNQDENLKQFQPGWIRYGLNMHNGGFDKLVKDTISDFFTEWDVSGWDRKLAILHLVMKLRNACLREAVGEELWELIGPIAERVSRAIVNHTVLLPDGSVAQWDWSQMSGDGLTTSNNCIAHVFIMVYMLAKANPFATDEEIMDQLVNIYGDDTFNGLSELFSRIKSEEFVNSIYKSFGMAVKAGSFKCQTNPEGMTFLGATVRSFKIGERLFFAPSYNKERVLAGLSMSIEPLDGDEELNKAFALLELGWFDCYDIIKSYIEHLFRVTPVTQTKKSFLRRGIPSRVEIRNKWAGVYGVD